MNILVVMSEARLWKPEYLDSVIKKLPSDCKVVGAVLTSFKPKRISKFDHIKNYVTLMGIIPFIIISFREVIVTLLDKLDNIITLPKYYSISGVLKRHKIPTKSFVNVNSEESLEWIKSVAPDIILSSGNQIFGKKLLAIPTKGCINRHSSLLPSYGGIYPIFWCMLNNEDYVGVSVHTMEEKLDAGVILAQKKYPLKKGDTFFGVFRELFKVGVDVTVEAITKLSKGDTSSGVEVVTQPSYYSYPKPSDKKKFNQMGWRIL